jgi:hypothetical protein
MQTLAPIPATRHLSRNIRNEATMISLFNISAWYARLNLALAGRVRRDRRTEGGRERAREGASKGASEGGSCSIAAKAGVQIECGACSHMC